MRQFTEDWRFSLVFFVKVDSGSRVACSHSEIRHFSTCTYFWKCSVRCQRSWYQSLSPHPENDLVVKWRGDGFLGTGSAKVSGCCASAEAFDAKMLVLTGPPAWSGQVKEANHPGPPRRVRCKVFMGTVCERRRGIGVMRGPAGQLAARSTDACDEDAWQGHALRRGRVDTFGEKDRSQCVGRSAVFAPDRPTIQFAVGEALCGMAKASAPRLKRSAHYLVQNPDEVWEFEETRADGSEAPGPEGVVWCKRLCVNSGCSSDASTRR